MYIVPVMKTMKTLCLLALALGPQSDERERLDHEIQLATGGAFWGVVLVAQENRVLLEKGYGNADYASRPNTPKTLFEVASTSKQFTAAAVLKLEMQGKLSIDDPIAEHFEGVPEDKAGITVRHLLNHTSGLSGEVGLPYASRATRTEFLETVFGAPLDTEPGTKFAYSNSGYALLAALVEVVTGESFEEYSARQLFTRAGMRDTGFIQDEHLDRDRMTARLESGRADATAADWHWSWGYRGMGGVVSTARDLLKWDEALRGTKVLSEEAKAKLYAPALGRYACGWKIEATPRGTTKVHHSGSVAGYRVQFARWLEEETVVIVLSNGACDVFAVERAVTDVLFPKPRVEARLDWTPYELAEYSSISFERETTWDARRKGASIELVAADPLEDHELAVVTLPDGYARKLAADLAGMVLSKPDVGDAGAEMELGVYLSRYDTSKKELTLTEEIEVIVMPRYVGMGEDGKRIVDERITLIVDDGANRMWPVMTKMNRPAAEQLIAALEELCGGLGSK